MAGNEREREKPVNYDDMVEEALKEILGDDIEIVDVEEFVNDCEKEGMRIGGKADKHLDEAIAEAERTKDFAIEQAMRFLQQQQIVIGPVDNKEVKGGGDQ